MLNYGVKEPEWEVDEIFYELMADLMVAGPHAPSGSGAGSSTTSVPHATSRVFC